MALVEVLMWQPWIRMELPAGGLCIYVALVDPPGSAPMALVGSFGSPHMGTVDRSAHMALVGMWEFMSDTCGYKWKPPHGTTGYAPGRAHETLVGLRPKCTHGYIWKCPHCTCRLPPPPPVQEPRRRGSLTPPREPTPSGGSPPPRTFYARDARHPARQANSRAYEPLNDLKKAR